MKIDPTWGIAGNFDLLIPARAAIGVPDSDGAHRLGGVAFGITQPNSPQFVPVLISTGNGT